MIWLILSPWLLWIMYVAVMRLKQVREAGQLTTAMKAFGYPLLAVGLVIDFFVNVVFGSLVLLEIPREWTLSARLWRWSNNPDGGWRQKLAKAVRVGLLDNIDPAGEHRG